MKELKSCLLKITNPERVNPGELPLILAKLDEFLQNEEDRLHPRLRHFLQNRSYAKALLWLNDEEPQKGSCGR